MELTLVGVLRTVKFDLVLTLALASVFLFVGYALQHRLRFLSRTSIPAPAIGGLLFALLVLALRGRLGIALDTSLRMPLQIAFFTTIGLGATLALLRAGGWRMGFFWFLASLTAVVQNVVGIGTALALGAPAALGIICGALTLTGGPATGLAFTETFEQMGIDGAGSLIIASATFGIFVSSLVGNPLATMLIKRFHLAPTPSAPEREAGANIIADMANEAGEGSDAQRDAPLSVLVHETGETDSAPLTGYVLLRHLAIILAVMGAGALFSLGLARAGAMLPTGVGKYVLLPGYIGAMIVAAVVRNVDDRVRWLKIDGRAVEALGTIALSLFLVIALMDLRLWELSNLALPMLVILPVQVVVMLLYASLVTFMLMGRDYEAAVTASGHVGFGLGIAPNAVANMEALTMRYASAPRSFLIVPVVGAFFIDFSNSLIINFFANLVR